MSRGFMKVYFHLSWKMKFPGFVFHLISCAVFISIYEFVWMSFFITISRRKKNDIDFYKVKISLYES